MGTEINRHIQRNTETAMKPIDIEVKVRAWLEVHEEAECTTYVDVARKISEVDPVVLASLWVKHKDYIKSVTKECYGHLLVIDDTSEPVAEDRTVLAEAPKYEHLGGMPCENHDYR